MRPIPKSQKFEYILVVIDYVSKWAEAEALPTNDARVVTNFLKKLFFRFGIPKALISDRGTHFCNKQMEKVLKRYGVHHCFATAYHLQTSGQVENINRALKRILKKWSERVLEKSNEPPISEGHTSGSGEGSMEYHFGLTDNVPPIPYASPLSGGSKDCSRHGDQQIEIEGQEARKEKKGKNPITYERRLFKGRVETSTDTSLGEDASKQGRNSDKTKIMFNDISTARPKVSVATLSTPPTTAIVFDDEDVTMDMAQTLIKMKEVKAKEKGVEFRNVEKDSRIVRSITTLQPLPKIDPKDKGKSVLVEEEPKKVKSKDQGLAQIKSDAELAQGLHEEELADSNRKREREQFTIEERAQLTTAAQRKFRAAQRAAEIRSKPPTNTQLRNLMMTYLKNTCGYKHSQLKGKTYEEIHEFYERHQKRNQDFIPMDSEKEVQESGKRLKRVAGSYATQKSPKKPKVMKSVKNVTEDEATEYKKEKEELRADGSSSYHGDMQAFLRRLGRQDLNDLYRMLFDPNEKDELWMNQLDWKLLKWKLHENCGAHTLFMDGTPMEINMLVEKKYPLIKELLEKVLNLQLEVEEESTVTTMT
ncbi:uncharacterized mitochondrial protein-like protein [Tanacetum coccineum]